MCGKWQKVVCDKWEIIGVCQMGELGMGLLRGDSVRGGGEGAVGQGGLD